MRIPENYRNESHEHTLSCISVGVSWSKGESERKREFGGCNGELFPRSTWLQRNTFQPWWAPGIWCLAERTVHMGCDPQCVYEFLCVCVCVQDSCPAHLPPLRLASFIINPDDQVAMSLCPCQGMLRSDLWTSIRHSSAHVHCSCTLLGWLDISALISVWWRYTMKCCTGQKLGRGTVFRHCCPTLNTMTIYELLKHW